MSSVKRIDWLFCAVVNLSNLPVEMGLSLGMRILVRQVVDIPIDSSARNFSTDLCHRRSSNLSRSQAPTLCGACPCLKLRRCLFQAGPNSHNPQFSEGNLPRPCGLNQLHHLVHQLHYCESIVYPDEAAGRTHAGSLIWLLESVDGCCISYLSPEQLVFRSTVSVRKNRGVLLNTFTLPGTLH